MDFSITASSEPPRVIVAAAPGEVAPPGWDAYTERDADITDATQLARIAPPNSIGAIVCEHCLEHLDQGQAAMNAILNFHTYLRPGGHVRIAVPDGFHPDPQYQQWVSPNGWDPTHKWIPNIQSLSQMLVRAGFIVQPLEYWDQNGWFHARQWSEDDGAIKRCPWTLNNALLSKFADCRYTSLIVDALKP